MGLSDIMSAMHLSTYPEVALLLFLGAFAAITVHVFHSKNAPDWELARHLPLESDGAAVRADALAVAPPRSEKTMP